MPFIRTPQVAAWSAALLLLSGCAEGDNPGGEETAAAPTSPSADRQVPLEVVASGDRTLAFVPVTIDGEGPFLFALDTGASKSAIDQGLADRIGLDPTGRSERVSGIAGTTEAPLVEIPQWQLGEVSLEGTEITALDLGTPQEGQGPQGLLGSDVLSTFEQITVDYNDEQLRLTE